MGEFRQRGRYPRKSRPSECSRPMYRQTTVSRDLGAMLIWIWLRRSDMAGRYDVFLLRDLGTPHRSQATGACNGAKMR